MRIVLDPARQRADEPGDPGRVAHAPPAGGAAGATGREKAMTTDQSVETVLAVFAAAEQRDDAALARACQPDVEFCWPPSLPYGGTARGRARPGEGWAAYWDWLQPTAALRRLDPRVVAAAGQEVVVLWRQRGLAPAGEFLDTEVLGLYRLRAGKLARGQMFYFDPAAVCAFLARTSRQAPARAAPETEPRAAGRAG
jgi:ketosteroid isomerase-like protein